MEPGVFTPAGTRAIWLRVGMLVDGSGGVPLERAHVVYNSREILHVGAENEPPPASLLAANQHQPDAELWEYTCLPGLIDAHAHFFLEGAELDAPKRAAYLTQTPEELLDLARRRLARVLAFGICAVRDAGDRNGVGLALSRLKRQPDRPLMPYVDSPGAAIHHRGRYGGFMAEPLEDFGSIEECVDAIIQAGADHIKIIPTGIINFKKGIVTSEPQMTVGEVRKIVEAARQAGRQTMAHASGDVGIEVALEGGVDSIEHGFFIRPDQLSRMRDRQVAWVPTFAPVQKQIDHAPQMGWDQQIVSNLRRILDDHAASLVQAQAMGVLIIAGSDAGSCGVAHGDGFLYELELMEKAGLSALEVIRSATGVSAGRLGFTERFGKVQAGCRPRLIFTKKSPYQNISQLRGGKVIVFDENVIQVPEQEDARGL